MGDDCADRGQGKGSSSTARAEAIRVATFTSTIVDDLILASGECHRSLLGGGAVHALWGMLLATDSRMSAAIVTRIGRDFPANLRAQLVSSGATLLLIEVDRPQPRGTTVFPTSGRGLREFTMDDEANYRANFRVQCADMPDAVLPGLAGLHLLSAPSRAVELIVDLMRRGFRGCVLIEPGPPHFAPALLPDYTALFTQIGVFSPNHEEAAQLLQIELPALDSDLESVLTTMVRRFLDLGAPHVALRCGRAGCLVACRDSSIAWRVPAFPGALVVDETGCGNSFCGAYTVAWTRAMFYRDASENWAPRNVVALKNDLLQAALEGSVAASLTLENVGVPALHSYCTPVGVDKCAGPCATTQEFRRRVEILRPLANELEIL